MIAWQLVLIQLVTFAALILALRMLFYRQLNAALRRLQGLQEETMAKDSQLKEELERAKQERAAEVEKGKEEAKLLVEAAKREAELLRHNVEAQAKQEAQKIVVRGQDELSKSRSELMTGMEADALRLCAEVLKYTFTEHTQQAFQHELIDELIREIGQMSKDQFSVKAEAVTVISSVPLEADERAHLSRTLSDKLGGAVTLNEQLDADLITGMVIRIGAMVIDGSLKNKLRKVLPLLKKEVSDTSA